MLAREEVVEELYQQLLMHLLPEDVLEAPVGEWIDESAHTLYISGCKVSGFLRHPKAFAGYFLGKYNNVFRAKELTLQKVIFAKWNQRNLEDSSWKSLGKTLKLRIQD